MRWWWGLGAVFGVLVLVRDLWWLWGFGYGVYSDSIGYVFGGDTTRTQPYHLLALLIGADRHPDALIVLQIVIAACAVGMLVAVLAREHLLFGALAGVALVTDLNLAMFNRWLLTESIMVSCGLLSLALMLVLWRASTRSWWLPVMIGAFWAWSVAIRPSNVWLLVPILLAALVLTRSWRQMAIASVGAASMLACLTVATRADTGQLRLYGGTGIYVAFPLVENDLFTAKAGPASQQLADILPACNITEAELSNPPHGEGDSSRLTYAAFRCLRIVGWSDEHIGTTFQAAYLEAIQSDPQRFASVVAAKSGAMLSWSPAVLPLGVFGLNSGAYMTICVSSKTGQLVACANDPSAWSATDRQAVIDALIPPARALSPVRELHLGLADLFGSYDLNQSRMTPEGEWTHGRWAVLIGSALVIMAGLCSRLAVVRLLTIWAVVLCGYTILTVTIGSVFIWRYAAPLNVWYALLSAAALASVLEWAWWGVRRGRAFLAPRLSPAGTLPGSGTPLRRRAGADAVPRP